MTDEEKVGGTVRITNPSSSYFGRCGELLEINRENPFGTMAIVRFTGGLRERTAFFMSEISFVEEEEESKP